MYLSTASRCFFSVLTTGLSPRNEADDLGNCMGKRLMVEIGWLYLMEPRFQDMSVEVGGM